MKKTKSAGYSIVTFVLGGTWESLIPVEARFWIATAALILLAIMFSVDYVSAKRKPVVRKRSSSKKKRRRRPPKKRKRK